MCHLQSILRFHLSTLLQLLTSPPYRLVNLAVGPPGLKFKQSNMPFVQMENISHFLRACQEPPFNLHQHDTFLTVDLFEKKDPAQVLQCIGAFSRAANAVNPSQFPITIGPSKAKPGPMSPPRPSSQVSGLRDRGSSVTSNGSSAYGAKPALPQRSGDSNSGRVSPTKGQEGSPGPVSTWSKREHEETTAPAWNIAQYGYMGGASQGNLGISFGGRRQIVNSGPKVPSLAEKEKLRREKEADEQHQLEEERRRKAEEEAEEERRWEEETRRVRNEERRKAEEEKRKWEEEERQWKLTEENRRQEEAEAEAKLEEERKHTKGQGDARLTGQFLSQYQAEAKNAEQAPNDAYSNRVKELEKELELARQREADYEKERQERSSRGSAVNVPKARSRSRGKVASPPQQQNRQESWSRSDERDFLQTQWKQHQQTEPSPEPEPIPEEEQIPEPTPEPPLQTVRSPRPLPDPSAIPTQSPVQTHTTGGSSRPLPDPNNYTSPQPAPQSRTDRFLSSNPAPAPLASATTYSRELGLTSERDAEDRRRVQSQTNTKAGGWASKSLLEREMEMERQRQQEWEEAQKETAAAARSGNGVDGIGGGIGGRWDVNQWSGFTGGDSQNKGNQGIGAGRRQIVGPRPLPRSNRG